MGVGAASHNREMFPLFLAPSGGHTGMFFTIMD